MTETRNPFRKDLLEGRTALVTGAGSGIGRETALLMAELGASVLLCGRRVEPLEETARLMAENGCGTARVHAMSIRDPQQARGAIAEAWAAFDTLDILVNNAGGQFPQAAIDFSTKGWLAVIDTNLNGTWHMMQAAAQAWRDRGMPGTIVNVVLDVWRGVPGMAHSIAARAGVIYASRTVAVEWAPLDIRINCVAPGLIETSGFEHYDPEVLARVQRDANPLRHPGTAADIAEACVYLAMPSNRFLTGEVLTVDGGQQLWGDVWAIPKPPHFRFES